MSKKKFTVLTCLVVALTLAVLAWHFANTGLPGNTTAEYNAYATQKAWADGSIQEDEILILESVSRSGGDTTVEFCVYSMPPGSSVADYLTLKVSEIPADTRLELIGRASCVFTGDQLSAIVGLNVVYLR